MKRLAKKNKEPLNICFFQEGDRFLKAAKALEHWPTGRGIFFNQDKTFLVWCGEEDHLRIISMQDVSHTEMLRNDKILLNLLS